VLDPQLAAHRLNEIAALLEVRGENPFKTRAFTQAARTISELDDEDISPLVRSKEISKLPGIGAGTLAVLTDLVEKGDSEYLESLRETTPIGLVEMMRVPGLGPTRIHRIHEGLRIESVAELEAAARDGRLARLSGFGIKTAEKILKGIAAMREKPDAMMHGKARTEATRLQRVIAKVDGVSRVEIAGSLRRQAEIVQDIDLVAACDGDRATAAAGAAQVPGVQEATVSGPGSLTLRMIKGERVDVHCVPGDALTVALWRATGSAAHVEQVMERLTSHGFSLDDDRLIDARGSVIPDVDEPMIYRSAGLAFVPPELREHRGEIEAAESGHLPRLIELGDLRGVLHCHSRYSDGATTIEEMATAAQARGWKYLGISDHS
jgi:DNA polymerase (family 10)